ncbi:Smr/MutS family protein [Mongoliibacter ruber]|uniref:Smr domain-containing protein n=1 Tax=Mongoliibacter ruber TaxID=1750599 RepID=A0A2T0WMN5_9BACT|nr:Smr/MutS family protein [Mongoliibacter ruber]PRY87963.1 Smr domain-containing protein [Mongoliibacter ruber]
MNIGDRVRLLHGNEEGVITKISSGGRVEIEIEDGFRIPAMKNEVVLISSTERTYFKNEPEDKSVVSETFSAKANNQSLEAIYLVYIPLNDKDHSVYLCNNTSKDFVTIASEHYGANSQTLISEKIAAKTSKKITEKSIQNFEEWPPLLVQLFPVNPRIEKTEGAFERKVKFKANTFFKSKGKAPILDKNGYVFRLTENAKEIDIQELNKELNSIVEKKEQSFPRPPKEIDLHIEKLTKNHDLMSNSEMIKLQMEVFERNLNYAIASGMDEISFIHGIGNGVLKKEIHKYLSQLGNIKYFQDTQKSRFGYGATLVRIS